MVSVNIPAFVLSHTTGIVAAVQTEQEVAMATRILFLDVNGTVIDDWAPAYEGLAAVLDHYGIERPTLETYIHEVGIDGDYHEFYLRRGIYASRDALYKIFSPVYREHATEIQLMPGVHEALRAMKATGVEIHILTAARKDFIEPLLLESGVHELCDSYHYHVHDKSEQVRAVVSGMHIPDNECVMVGDLPSDVVHAKRADIRAVGFHNPHVPKDVFTDIFDMDYFTFSFQGLADYVCNT